MQKNEGEMSVEVQMLGHFLLSVNGKHISDQDNQMNKLWNLLAYLLYHRNRIVTQQEFIQQFWARSGGSAPVNALKTQLFRIRKILASLFGEAIRPILSFRGGYQWNPAVPVNIDVEAFAALCQRLERADTSVAKRETLSAEAVALYRGTFMSKLSHQEWVQEAEVHYKALYLKMIREYGALLEKREAYEELVVLFQGASEIYPLEESFHTGIVRGLLEQERHGEALSHYEEATDLLYRSLGIQPWKELRELYDRIMATEQLFEVDLTVIQQDLGETLKKEGAFFCEYGSFREIYRLEARRAARSGTETHLALLTLLNQDGSIPEARLVEKTMEQLKTAVANSLRSGDVFTRYSSAQYIIMLPETSLQEAEMIISRISAKLWRRYRTPKLKLSSRIRKLNLAKGMNLGERKTSEEG